MNTNTIKAITIALFAAALYVLYKGRTAKTITGAAPSGVRTRAFCNLPRGAMESSTCAIPLATDFLKCAFPHAPATAPISTRAPRSFPPIRQPKSCKVFHPTVSPVGVMGNPAACIPVLTSWPAPSVCGPLPLAPSTAVNSSVYCCGKATACDKSCTLCSGDSYYSCYLCSCRCGHRYHCNSAGGCGTTGLGVGCGISDCLW
jgi:hypothetical protein